MHANNGIYITLEELLSQQATGRHIANGLNALSKNMLQGNRPSKEHGRGGAFDQIRNYLAGDDVRNIDWNVTARMGKPFVRVFNEERESPLLLLVDQSSDMFFATRKQLKSVVAAKLAANLLWMSQHKKRPGGAVVFGDKGHAAHRPRSHQSHLHGILNDLAIYNQALSKESDASDRTFCLADALQQLLRMVSNDAIVVLISDFVQADKQCWQLIERLRLKANVIATPIYDGVVQALPQEGHFLARYAGLEAELNFSSYAARDKVTQGAQGRIEGLHHHFADLGIPVLEFSTYEEVEQQLTSGLFIDGGQHA